MRDSTKVIIGFGSIWGLFFFGGMLLSSFTLGANDSTPEVLAILLNGLTILPSCICAIWFMRYAALWLMFLSAITAFGLVYQQIHSSKPVGDFWGEAGGLTWALIVAAIPGAIGILGVTTPNVQNSTVRLRCKNLLPSGCESQYLCATQNTGLSGGSRIIA
jgi:hypothetical protein